MGGPWYKSSLWEVDDSPILTFLKVFYHYYNSFVVMCWTIIAIFFNCQAFELLAMLTSKMCSYPMLNQFEIARKISFLCFHLQTNPNPNPASLSPGPGIRQPRVLVAAGPPAGAAAAGGGVLRQARWESHLRGPAGAGLLLRGPQERYARHRYRAALGAG